MNTSVRKSQDLLTYAWLDRCRWNVLDLITIIGRQTIPTTIFCDVDMSWAEGLRKKFLVRGIRLTETAILIKAIGIAQRNHPASRSTILPWGRIATFENICAGITIERMVGSQPAVFFGTIESPAEKSLETIMNELRQFSESNINDHPQLALESKFSKMPWLLRQLIFRLAMVIPEFRLRSLGATFGISSLGKFGVKAITGPCVCTSTFGVGAVEDRPIARKGQIVIRPILTLSLLFDHRCIDGASAARFLKEVKEILEGRLEDLLFAETPSSSAKEVEGLPFALTSSKIYPVTHD